MFPLLFSADLECCLYVNVYWLLIHSTISLTECAPQPRPKPCGLSGLKLNLAELKGILFLCYK